MKWINFRQHRNEKGQAMIEFILGLMIVISFFFFYLKMSAVFAVGNYVHYATFMSARAYASSAQNPDAQRENASAVLTAMLGNRFKTLIKGKEGDGSSITGATIGPGPYYAEEPALDNWNQGVMFHFTSKLSLYPWSRDGQSVMLDLTSESWMPREDSTDECLGKKQKITGMLSGSGVNNVGVEWDNGC
jgi:hypothetical protein